MKHALHGHRAFTLIELSVVLVIIGLIVGGVLVGRDLISAASVRAQLSQIEEYQQAVNTFKGKYGYLPGDIPEPDASRFGFLARGVHAGQGDGNGFIEGVRTLGAGQNSPIAVAGGETAVFWRDLTVARLIDQRFATASISNSTSATITETSTPSLPRYIPRASISPNYIHVTGTGGQNYFVLSAVYSLLDPYPQANPGLTVAAASSIDKKTDDGLPQSGNVTARYHAYNVSFNLPAIIYSQGAGNQGPTDTTATAGSATTCFDNNNAGGAVQQYSIAQNNGTGVNCALSFKFQ